MYLYSLSKHTLIDLLTIQFIKTVKEGGYMYHIVETNGEAYDEVRPENWIELMLELNREDKILEFIDDILED